MPPVSPRKLAALMGAALLSMPAAGVVGSAHAQGAVEASSLRFKILAGACPVAASAPGSVALRLPAFGYAVCAATRDT